MLPLVENNFNLCELGPRSTGKSHLYKEIVKKAGSFEQDIHTLVNVAHKDHGGGGSLFFLATGKGTGGHVILHDLDAVLVFEPDTCHLIARPLRRKNGSM